ncbi:hypothetical protein C8T65DRAFT_264135 [Cerioporus squamosus]|nr:hypothetical protein C8T65DRAFT_264135 [Cerioporus squamosus]
MRVHGPLDETYDERCHPNRHDGGHLFPALVLRHSARTPVDYDSFAADLGLLEHKFYGYECQMDVGLTSLLPSHGSEMWTSWLKRPNALYFCPECSKTALPWPDINVHWCEEHPDETIWAAIYDSYRRPKVKWWQAGEDVAHRILDAARLCRTTPMYRLNLHIKQGRLYCNCGDPSFGPANRQAWAELVLHVYMHTRMNEDRQNADTGDELVWRNDHTVEECIVKLNLEGKVDAAQMRYVTPEASIISRVDAHLAKCPSGFLPICRLCKKMTRKDKDMWMVLPPRADAILYHMSAKHGRAFSEADILFETPWYLPRHRHHRWHWGRFALDPEEKGSWPEGIYLC